MTQPDDKIRAYPDGLPRVVGIIRVDRYDEERGALIGRYDSVQVDDLDDLPEVGEPGRVDGQ